MGGGYLSNTRLKGFTLVELLAVIIILAVIALIATPTITNIIEGTKKSAVKDSTYGYIKGIENQIAYTSLSGKEYEDRDDYTYDEIKVDVKGTRPTSGFYSLKNGVVTSGVFCIDGYTVEYLENNIEVKEKCNEDELKLLGSIKLSSYSGNYIYPTKGTFEVIENISGGKLNCTTGDSNIATCSISGNVVTVTPGTKKGNTTITIISESTSKYKEAQAAYEAITAEGTLESITANGYTGIYDGEAHGITVKAENAIIKYGEEEGNCELDASPIYSDVGTYTVYYEITKAGYNKVKGSKEVVITQAEGKIILEEETGKVEYNEIKEIKIKENKSNGEIKVTSSNTEIAEAKVEDGILKISGKKTGKATIIVKSEETHNYKEAETKYEVEVIKANNTLEIKPTSGNYKYPTSGTFEVIENKSGGALSCETSDSSVATCSIEGNKVTVKPGTKEGQASITIKSEATANYNGTQTVHLANTAKGTLNSYTVTGYKGIYDGKAYGITVTSSGSTIKYGEEEGTYDKTESPKYSDVGTYTVYYQIETEGYTTIKGKETVEITKAEGTLTAPTAKTLTYTEKEQELIKAGSSSTGEMQYKLEDGVWSTSIPKATNPGTYKVYYKVVGDKNHNNIEEKSITVTISKATISYTSGSYTGVYDGESHGITVSTTLSGATIKYGTSEGIYDKTTNPIYIDVGTYTVYYQITKEGYTTVKGFETVTITKANNTLEIKPTTGNYTYPESGTFEVIKNTSGGNLSCTTSDSAVATCEVSGTTVTVTPGTKEGQASITIKSEATANYNGTQTVHLANTAKGTIPSVTVTGYTGTYDGASHGITVTTTLSGATIKYGTSNGSYTTTTNPTYKDAGTYTVYYEITKEGYTTITGSQKVVINKANGNVTAPTAKTLTYTGSAQTLINAGSSSTGTIQYKLGSSGTYSTSLPSATNAGTYTVYYRVLESTNYNDVTEKSITVTINKAEGKVTAPTGKTLTWTGSTQTLINEGSSNTGTIQYKLGSSGTYSTSLPSATNVGTYTVYYKVLEGTNHNAVSEKSITVTIGKANNTLEINPTSANYTYPTKGTFTITKNTSGGALSCTTSNSSIATCSISGTTVTVTPGTTAGSATITVTSAATTNYNSVSAAHVATTAKGTIPSVTATGYTGTYDGKAHGITVSTTLSGATIKYGTTSGTYDKTSSPTYTNAGTYTVYYQITKSGYTTVTGSKQVVISKAANPISVTAKSLTYTGSAQSLVTVSGAQGNVCYSTSAAPTSCSAAGSIPTGTNAGTYTVYYYVAGNTNYNTKSGNVKVTIAKKADVITITSQTYTYNGSGRATSASTTSGLTPTVTYYSDSSCATKTTTSNATAAGGTPKNAGTYYATATTAGNTNYNTASKGCTKAVVINKAANTLTLSAGSANYTYPTSRTFTITKNTSGGALSCTTSNSAVATCSISGTTVTVTPGTTSGSATITVTSAATTNYNSVSAAHEAITAKGTIPSVTASGYSGTYDGKAHGITVSTTLSGATIKYGTSNGSYTTTTSPTYTNAGTYTVYYQITKSGYTTVTGNKQVVISKAAGSATLSSSSGTVYLGESNTVTVSGATGTLSCKSSNTSVATCSISGTTVTVKGVATGTATITINVAASTNYNVTSKTYSVTAKNKTLSNIVKIGDYVKMTPTSTSFTTETSKTGYTSTQTINPSELNLWRVIRVNSDGTIEMVSEYVSSTSLFFGFKEGYKNYVGYLNVLANQYQNTKYTIKTRHMGYNGQTEYLTDTANTVDSTVEIAPWTCTTGESCNSIEKQGGGDILYTVDINLVTEAIGSFKATKPNGDMGIYWLASREYEYRSASWYTYWYYSIRRVNRFGNDIESNSLAFYQDDEFKEMNSYSSALRPIVTLKSGLALPTGSGTSGDPYVLP